MRKISTLSAAMAVVCLMAFGASAAQAAGIGGSSFTGNSSAYGVRSHVFSIGTALTARCDASVSGTVSSPVATFGITYSNCRVQIGLLQYNASVSTGGNWTLDASAGTYYGPDWDGATVTTSGTTTITLTGSSCTISVPSGTTADAAGVNTGSPASGTSIDATGSGISYTSSGCPGVPASGSNATYSGSVDVTGAWGTP